MIEIIVSYIIIFAPALISALGIIAGVVKIFSGAKSAKEQIVAIKDEAIAAFNAIRESNELKQLRDYTKAIIDENHQLKAALTECTDALTRIRKRHPELFADKED